MSRYRLAPTTTQLEGLLRHCSDARYTWNLCVEQESWWRRDRGMMPGLAARCRQLSAARADNPWLAGGSVIVQQQAIRDHGPATVSRTAQRWFVSFTVEVERDVPERHAWPGTAAGVDLGVKTLLTGFDNTGNVIEAEGPKPLKTALRKLRRASREHSRKVKGSANRRKSAARLARIHARVANVRADALHKATSGLARRYETVVIEDLNVAGMTRNRRLARAISDQGFGRARRMLEYKTGWNGGKVILAGRFYPSSKACSGCGAGKAKLSLSERTFRCEHCGLALDRDVNAARNLHTLAASGAESINACGGTVRPGLAGDDPLKQEPGTAHAGKTGTASRQREAAAGTGHH